MLLIHFLAGWEPFPWLTVRRSPCVSDSCAPRVTPLGWPHSPGAAASGRGSPDPPWEAVLPQPDSCCPQWLYCPVISRCCLWSADAALYLQKLPCICRNHPRFLSPDRPSWPFHQSRREVLCPIKRHLCPSNSAPPTKFHLYHTVCFSLDHPKYTPQISQLQ